jgi:ATP-dependent Clp protease ATP-binding subunit ClpA
MLSSELEFCLNEAFQSARERRHEFMTVEHLLLALLDIPKVHEILKACNSNVGQLRRQLTEFIDEATPLMPLDEEGEVQPTLGFQRVLQRAVFHVQSSGKKEVTGSNVLVAIFSEKQSQAVYFLGLQDVTRLDIVNYISHGMPQLPGEQSEDEQEISLDPDAESESSAANPLPPAQEQSPVCW